MTTGEGKDSQQNKKCTKLEKTKMENEDDIKMVDTLQCKQPNRLKGGGGVEEEEQRSKAECDTAELPTVFFFLFVV